MPIAPPSRPILFRFRSGSSPPPVTLSAGRAASFLSAPVPRLPSSPRRRAAASSIGLPLRLRGTPPCRAVPVPGRACAERRGNARARYAERRWLGTRALPLRLPRGTRLPVRCAYRQRRLRASSSCSSSLTPPRRCQDDACVAKMASHAIFQYNVLAIDDTHNTWTNMIVKMNIPRLLGSSDDKEKIGVARPEGPPLRGFRW